MSSIEYPTLFTVTPRDVPSLPKEFIGDTHKGCGYTESNPRRWTSQEIEFIMDLKQQGYTNAEIARTTGRTETSISIKLKRIGKTDESYNDKHRDEKYAANVDFLSQCDPETVLDAYCGTEKWWNKQLIRGVISNDSNKDIVADYNLPAEKLVAKLYSEDRQFDLIDLDPFGSAYDCFDLSIRMAKKGIIITFGEMGHKRWKRLDFVSRHYGIESVSDFTTARLIDEVCRIGRMHKKQLVPVIVKEWPRISRVYFEIKPMKIIEQWQ